MRRGTAPGRLGVANDIKPGVSNGHGHTEPSTVAEDRHAINAIARHPQSPDLTANVKPEDTASGARPWPSVKQPTVRTDRDGARIPSAIRPWTPRHSGPQRYKMTHHGTEKKRPA